MMQIGPLSIKEWTISYWCYHQCREIHMQNNCSNCQIVWGKRKWMKSKDALDLGGEHAKCINELGLIMIKEDQL